MKFLLPLALSAAVLPSDSLDRTIHCFSRSAAMQRAISYCAGADEICNQFVVRLEGSDDFRLEKCLDFSAERCAMVVGLPREQLMKECPDWVPPFIKAGAYGM